MAEIVLIINTDTNIHAGAHTRNSIVERWDRSRRATRIFFFHPSLLLFFSLSSFFKSRFCYRSGAGVRQRNRMSAHAGCDVRAAGKPTSTVNLPDCLQRKYFLFMRLLLLLPIAPPPLSLSLLSLPCTDLLSLYINSFVLRLAHDMNII